MSVFLYQQGDSVRVASIQQIGTIEACLGDGRYRVAVGSLKITCTTTDLSPSRVKPEARAVTPAIHSTTLPPRPRPCIDLHGQTVEESIRILDRWLDAAILHGLSDVRIIHGLGTGRVQSAVHQHLRLLKAVRHFKINDSNPGETLVYL